MAIKRTIIGWREWAGLPDFGVDAVNAKIDTGAKSSAIHAFKIIEVMIDGKPYVEFFLYPVQRLRKPKIFCRAPLIDTRMIKSSNGVEEERFVIETDLQLGRRRWRIDLTLTNRDVMEHRMLIGRDALCGRFIIDPSGSYLLGDGAGE